MYDVVEFKLLPGLDVRVKPRYLNFFDSDEGDSSLQRIISVTVPDSGDQDITLMAYLVGEKVVLRKSLHGLRLVKGLPDFSGCMTRVDLTGTMEMHVAARKDRFLKKKHSDHIPQNNLCMEIPLPGGDTPWPGNIDWANTTGLGQTLRRQVFTDTSRTMETLSDVMEARRNQDPQMQAFSELMATELRYTMNRDGFARTVTGRITGDRPNMTDMYVAEAEATRSLYYQRSRYPGRSVPVQSISHRYSGMDFDGDTLRSMAALLRNEDDRRFREEVARMSVESAPTRFLDNRYDYREGQYEVTEVDLVSAVTAARELTEGERARPPQSRGPRPRNQRW